MSSITKCDHCGKPVSSSRVWPVGTGCAQQWWGGCCYAHTEPVHGPLSPCVREETYAEGFSDGVAAERERIAGLFTARANDLASLAAKQTGGDRSVTDAAAHVLRSVVASIRGGKDLKS